MLSIRTSIPCVLLVELFETCSVIGPSNPNIIRIRLGLDAPAREIVPSENWELDKLHGIHFQKLEIDFIKKFKDHLRCPTCKNYDMANKGAAGAPGAAGNNR